MTSTWVPRLRTALDRFFRRAAVDVAVMALLLVSVVLLLIEFYGELAGDALARVGVTGDVITGIGVRGRGVPVPGRDRPPPGRAAGARTGGFVDGQNLFHAARASFGCSYPNYDVLALAQAVCCKAGWTLTQARFYTSMPALSDDAFWHHFWTAKLSVMGRQGVKVYSRRLRYRNRKVRLPDGRVHTFITGEEKGIDVRIALDVIAMGHRNEYDVAVIFSQDQDLSDVAEEVRVIAREHSGEFFARLNDPMDRTQVRQGWLDAARASFPKGALARRFRAVDPDGQEWEITKAGIQKGRKFAL